MYSSVNISWKDWRRRIVYYTVFYCHRHHPRGLSRNLLLLTSLDHNDVYGREPIFTAENEVWRLMKAHHRIMLPSNFFVGVSPDGVVVATTARIGCSQNLHGSVIFVDPVIWSSYSQWRGSSTDLVECYMGLTH